MSERPKKVPRRERLIEIGLELFSSRSYDEVAIDDIANKKTLCELAVTMLLTTLEKVQAITTLLS